MLTSYNNLRAKLEPALGIGPLTYLGATITSSTGSRGLLQFMGAQIQNNVDTGEFRLAVGLIAPTVEELYASLSTTLKGLKETFNGGINQSCLLGTGGIATLRRYAVSDLEGMSNNATQSTLSAVKCYIGAEISVMGLA